MSRIRSGRPARPIARPKKGSQTGKRTSPASQLKTTQKAEGRKNRGSHLREPEANEARSRSKGKQRADSDDEQEFAGFAGFPVGMQSDEEAEAAALDDEELDSDEADTSGEDEPSGSSRKPRPAARRHAPPAASLEQEDVNDDGEEEDGPDYMDISEMLDRPESSSASDSESDEGEAEGLDAFVSSLPLAANRNEQDGEQAPRKRRRVLLERNDAPPENEFAAIDVTDQKKIRLEDMLSSLPAAQRATMRKTLKALAPTAPLSGEDAPKHILKMPGPLPAPLPLMAQAKIDRKAANEQLSKEIEGWSDTLRTMKGIGKEGQSFGGNRLVLPLGTTTGPTAEPSSGEVLSKFTPRNELEKSVRQVLESAQTSQKATEAREAAALAALGPDERASRLAEVRRQRELLFRAERKAKRVAKIKSKAYHRLQKRARQRAQLEGEDGLTLEELAQLDEADGGERASEMREKMEMLRAKERATLRHAPGASKWSQAMQGLTGLDDNDRAAYQERSDRQEELRRKVLGHDGSDSDDADGDLEDDADEDAIRASAFDELANFNAKEDSKAANARPSGLAAMKFMQKAQADQQKIADELECSFRAGLTGEDDQDSWTEEVESNSHLLNGNSGRMTFKPSTAPRVQHSVPASENASHKVRTTATSGPVEIVLPVSAQPTFNPFSAKSHTSGENSSNNPWLAIGDEARKKMSTKNDADTSRAAKAAQRATLKLEKQKKRSVSSRQAVEDEETVIIDTDLMNEPMHIADRQQAQFGEQQELVARAFAGDDVVADFALAKQAEIDRDAPKEVDETLPGWGSWGGKGVRKSRRTPILRIVPGIDAKQRKDAKLSHVIISERRDKKSSKYLIKDLPFPYTSAAQREQALRQPLGKEFATDSSNRVATKPSVLSRPGVLITPVMKGS